MIPYGRQSISEEDILAVVDVLRSDYLTQGPVVPQFEEALANKVGARYACAVNSATSGLHIACLALGVGPGDRVWTSPNTFVASANCARYCGATVDFVDIDPITYNISLAALRVKLDAAKQEGTLPKVLIPVHFAGQPCDLIELHELSHRYGFRIIEDASHAVGATYDGAPVGDCRYSDITVFSFHPVKIITSGEGGMATTNIPELATRMALLRSHGITRDPALLRADNPPPWHYEQQMLGFNYRMIDMEAALGLSQLQRLEAFVTRRNDLAKRYDALLDAASVICPTVLSNRRSSFHLYVIRLPENDRARHRAVFEALRNAGIGVNLHYRPVHLQPDFAQLGFTRGMFKNAEYFAGTAITLPLFPAMSEDQQDRVVEALSQTLT